MAKWGEGDPRWIVEERPDGTNVNNWHWTEKNACGWSTNKFKELFNDLCIENDVIKCKIEEENCKGEAVANNRKGKLIFFYEWDITLKWKGKLVSGGEKTVTGKINIPNLSEENEIHEVDINVTVDESTPEAETVKDVMRGIGTDKIREQLEKYVKCLKAEFSQGMILPSKITNNSNKKSKETIGNLSEGIESKVGMNNSNRNDSQGKNSENSKGENVQLNTTTIEITKKFQCTGPELYNALTCNEMVVAFTRGPVKLDVKKGGEFQFFGGNIYGEFIDLIPNLKIVQTWRYKRWPEGHFSVVTIDINQQSDHTELKLRQTGVPVAEAEVTKENWKRYYWDSLKTTFGFGYFI